jgi:hypothetical protein
MLFYTFCWCMSFLYCCVIYTFMSSYFNSYVLAHSLHWCMIILNVSLLLRCDTNLWRLKLLCSKHCLCQVAFGFVFRHHCSQLSSHSPPQLVRKYVYTRAEGNKIFSLVSRLRPTHFTYQSLQSKCKWKKHEIYRVFFAGAVSCFFISFDVIYNTRVHSWATVLQLAAYFICQKLVSHYDFRVSHQCVLMEELAVACLLGRRPNWCERQMSMHGGTWSGFVSAGSRSHSQHAIQRKWKVLSVWLLNIWQHGYTENYLALRDFHTLYEYLYRFWVEMTGDINYSNSRIFIFSNLQTIFMSDPALVLVILYFSGAVLCHEFRFPH